MSFNNRNPLIYIVAKAKAPTTKGITLTYNANGGINPPASETKTVATNASATFTISGDTPTRENYNFLGWADGKDATTPDYTAGNQLTTSTSKTIYAVWQQKTTPTEPSALDWNVTTGLADKFRKSLTVADGSNMSPEVFTITVTSNNGLGTVTGQTVAMNTTDVKPFTFASGKFTFPKAGTYTFTVKEDASKATEDMTYDGTVYTMTVKVAKNAAGTALEVKGVTITGGTTDTAIFNNRYEPEVEPTPATLNADELTAMFQKSLTVTQGSTMAEEAFTITLTDKEDPTKTVSGTTALMSQTGKADFNFTGSLTFDDEGEYTFIVKEDDSKKTKGMTYDQNEYKMTVKVVKDSAADALNIEKITIVDNQNQAVNGKVTFNNTYDKKAPATEAVLDGAALSNLFKKDLTVNEAMTDGEEFKIVVKDAQGVEVACGNTAKMKTAKTEFFEFAVTTKLTFDKADTYTYTVEEVPGANTDGKMTYDTTKYTMTVVVSEENNVLKTDVSFKPENDTTADPAGMVTFKNTYGTKTTPTAPTAPPDWTQYLVRVDCVNEGGTDFGISKYPGSKPWFTETGIVQDANGDYTYTITINKQAFIDMFSNTEVNGKRIRPDHVEVGSAANTITWKWENGAWVCKTPDVEGTRSNVKVRINVKCVAPETLTSTVMVMVECVAENLTVKHYNNYFGIPVKSYTTSGVEKKNGAYFYSVTLTPDYYVDTYNKNAENNSFRKHVLVGTPDMTITWKWVDGAWVCQNPDLSGGKAAVDAVLKVQVKCVYNVTFNTDGGTPVPGVQEVQWNDKATKPATDPTKTGYEFKDWFADGAAKAFNFDTTAITGDINLTAKWEKKEYTVSSSLYLNGSTESCKNDKGNVISKTVKGLYEEKIDYATLKKELKQLALDADAANKPNQSKVDLKICWNDKSGRVFDAETYGQPGYNWREMQYQTKHWTVVYTWAYAWTYYDVTFDVNGGEGTIDAQLVKNGDKAKEPTTVPTKDCHRFLGWFDADGNKFDFDKPITKSMTLYAKWELVEVNTYIIPRNSSNGMLNEDGGIPLNENTLERVGLQDYAKNSGTKYQSVLIGNFTSNAAIANPDDYFNGDPEVVAATKEMNAKLKLDAGINKATFDKNDILGKTEWTWLHVATGVKKDTEDYLSGDLMFYSAMFKTEDSENVKGMPKANYDTIYDYYIEGETITMPANPERTGYDFKGWAVTATPGAVIVYATADPTLLKAGDTYTVKDGDVTFTAQWEKQTYTVKFDSKGGSSVPEQKVPYKNKAAEPKAPTKSGYTFDGWYTDEQYTTKYNFANEVTGNMTLYAKWSQRYEPNPLKPSGTTKTDGKTDGKTVKSGDTFDAGISLYVGLGILSLTGSAAAIYKRREEY